MSGSTTLMYAELLSNIRQISVIAALETPSNSSTKAELSPDGRQFLLHHDGKANILTLPGPAATNSRLQIPALSAEELSWRLPLDGEPDKPSAESNDAPWPAKDLTESTEFLCRSCGEVVVRRGKIKDWRDLPSENWAEMMDFWHCHKPTVPEPSGSGSGGHPHDDPAMARGYGANAKFTAQPEIGFVDLTTMLLAESDCQRVEPKEQPHEQSKEQSNEHPQYQTLTCQSCNTYIGHRDHPAEGYRLYKWRLKTHPTSSLSYDQPSTSSIITSQLQSIMLAQCSSRLLLVPTTWNPSSQPPSPPPPPSTPSPPLLHLWILNPSLRYSSTSPPPPQHQHRPTLAMKIFSKPVASPRDAANLLDADGVEEVSLPEETIWEVVEGLARSRECLPPSARGFRGWDVGLLERFEGR